MVKIIVSAAAAAIFLGVLGGYLLWHSFSPVGREAVAFAKINDDNACLDESLSRLAGCTGTGCQMRSLVFAHLCFPIAAPSHQLCAGVPRGLFEGVSWAVDQCETLSLPVSACERIHTEAAKTCLSISRDTPVPRATSNGEPGEVVLGRIPAIDAKVIALRFFESGEDDVDYDNLAYQTRFLSASSRYINWELEFEFPPLGEDLTVDIVSIYHWPDGSVMTEMTWPAELQTGWTTTWQSYGWGWSEAGNWPPGVYRVEVFAEGQRAASGSFVIE